MTEQQGSPTDKLNADGEREASIRSFVERSLPTSIADLTDLVRIPSVSWDSFDPARVADSADAVAALFEATGVFDSVDVARAKTQTGESGQPAVLATRAARNGRPTVLLYAHHDVQPPGSDADWQSPPFEPTVRGDRLYGRGAADDKAGVVSHVAAVRALADTFGDDLDLGLVIFIEGEEEFGSNSFVDFLETHRDQMAADVIIVADSDNWNVDTPALTVSLRGNATFTLTVSTLEHASHSGMFGGAAPDAMLAGIRLLSTLWNDDGSVAVDGLTSSDMAVPDASDETFSTDAALLPGVAPIGHGPLLSRLWAQPTITVTGVDAPTVANASNTLLPSVAFKISSRVAPGQDAQAALDALTRHLTAHAPFGAHLELSEVNTGQPFLVDTSGWAVAEAKRAMADGWGREPLETGVGGSIPFISDLVRVFPEAQILVTGVEDPDSRAHSPNESLHLGVFKRAILTEALLLARLAGQTTDELAQNGSTTT
ncbi:dipeptidase [Subtercola sp. YIM 133946]|uniref:dipeptidase n=1 Tax=Subtercola sp. YIM 133946 TaxID=3118909 RepID=UPI002F95E461